MKKRLQERINQQLTLVERAEGQTGRLVKAIGITANVVNANRRRYPAAVLKSAVEKLNLGESASQGRFIALGEAEHPGDKSGRPSLLETVIKWEASSFDGSHVLLEGVILPTRQGQDVLALLEHGVPVGVSMRGFGETRTVKENGRKVEEVTELTITGFDLVGDPSDPDAGLTESKGDRAMDEEEQKKLQEALDAERKEKAELQKQLDEARKSETELAERKRQEAVDAAITEVAKDLKYGDGMNGMFVKAVKAAKPESPEAVKAIVEAKRAEYDALAADWKLAQMGKRGVTATAPVFERETGLPAFVRPAWELTEAVSRADNRQRRDLAKAESMAERFAARYLELFDRQYRNQLIAEARAFEEAEQTSDLNLPYSVMRSIVEQVWSELVAANVYDIGVATQSPERLYFETYAGESGATAAVADESVTGDHGNWVALANARLTIGTVGLTNNTGVTTYTEGTDYVIDYGAGKIMTLATGTTTDSQVLLIDYSYNVMRKGEMAAIQRGKNTLSYKTLDIAADRMAAQIGSEAIVFSRSQLGYDALGRTLANLTRQVQRRIDEGMHYLAIAAAVQQANNSGGTWTAASDDVVKFVEKIGVAKTKVYNRYYLPTAIVMSQTNADRLSNWEGFTRVGFPNAVLTAAGFAGGVKGLPIFATPTFSDKYVLVCNREVVMHRVFQAMQLKGPFPTYSSDKLVAADQYYIEEYNGTDAPVVEKAAYMIVA